MKNNTERRYNMAYFARAGVIAALYAAMTIAQQLLLPGSASLSVQFRVSEALMLLCIYFPEAVPGLTIGCFLANLLTAGALPVDMLLGAFATLLAGITMQKLKNFRIKGIPFVSALMPALFNGVIIGWELETFYIAGSFHIQSFLVQAGLVALGEITVCLVLGLPFAAIVEKRLLPRIKNGR